MNKIIHELKQHIPFTALGALLGVLTIFLLAGLSQEVNELVFHIFHPAHILVSTFVTAAIFQRYNKNIYLAVLVGIIVSILFCTLSDAVLPFLGSKMIGSDIYFHVDLIEHPLIVLIPAVVGSLLGSLLLYTKIPHLFHVFFSTAASLFYLLAYTVVPGIVFAPAIFIILFFSVWLPCCLGDIVLPIWIGKK
jgi:hypothetical protein